MVWLVYFDIREIPWPFLMTPPFERATYTPRGYLHYGLTDFNFLCYNSRDPIPVSYDAAELDFGRTILLIEVFWLMSLHTLSYHYVRTPSSPLPTTLYMIVDPHPLL
jgi:hypothetical protein